MSKYVIVYNTSNDSVQLDDAGHVVAPRTWAAAQRSQVQDDISGERLVVVKPDTIDEKSNPEAWTAKQEYELLEEAWAAEKASVAEPEEDKLPTDYDDRETAPKAVAKKVSSPAKRSAN